MITLSWIMFFTAFKLAGLDFPTLQFNSGMSQLSVPMVKLRKEGQPGFAQSASGRAFIVFSSGATLGFPSTVELNCDLPGGLAAATGAWGNLKLSDEGSGGLPPRMSSGNAMELRWLKVPHIQIVNSDLPDAIQCDQLVGSNGHLLPKFIPLDATTALAFLSNLLMLMIMFVVLAQTISLTRKSAPAVPGSYHRKNP
jgi:hypothetical protein